MLLKNEAILPLETVETRLAVAQGKIWGRCIPAAAAALGDQRHFETYTTWD